MRVVSALIAATWHNHHTGTPARRSPIAGHH
jgi:hypothetical protein